MNQFVDEQASLLHRTGEWISSAVVSVNKDAGACSWNGIGLTELPQGINRAEGIIFLGGSVFGEGGVLRKNKYRRRNNGN